MSICLWNFGHTVSYGPLIGQSQGRKAISQKLWKLGCYGNANVDVPVVVNFLCLLCPLIIIFLLFLGMLMYPNEFKTKEKQKLTEIKN